MDDRTAPRPRLLRSLAAAMLLVTLCVGAGAVLLPDPATLPGTIEAEGFNAGGEGVGYHDTSPGNSGGAVCRTAEDVDIAVLPGGGYAVTGIEDGEWLAFTIAGVMRSPDLPALVLYLASDRDGGSVEIETNGRVAGTVNVPNTGSTTVFRPVQTQVAAAPGSLRLRFRGGGMSLDRIESPRFEFWADAYPRPDFTAEPASGTVPLTVRFTDRSSAYAYDWRWDFGDGAVSTERNPVHIFLSPGVYPVRLTIREAPHWSGGAYVNIWNDAGSPGPMKTVNVTVEGPGPGPSGGTVPGVIQAEDYDPGGEGVAYHDTTPGNSGGAYRQDDVDIETAGGITNVGWIRDGEWLKYSTNVRWTGDYDVVFRVSSPQSNTRITLLVDGVTATTITVPNTGSYETFTNVTQKVRLASGPHVLRLIFSGYHDIDWIAFAGGTIMPICTQPPPPAADFSANRTSGPAPLAVQFTDTSTWSAPGPCTYGTWGWDFGDGTTVTDVRDPVHTYTSAGTYAVNLTVGNSAGTDSEMRAGLITVTAAVAAVPQGTAPPTDIDSDGTYEDVNGNGRPDFADVVLYFNQMGWIAANEPVPAFDCNGNGRIDFADVVRLFDLLGGAPAPASVFSTINETEPGLYRFSAAEVQAVRAATPYEWDPWTGTTATRTSRVDPMQILGMYPLLRLRDGFVLRAYVTGDMMGANGIVFALPVGQASAPPGTPGSDSPSTGTGLPPGADLNFTAYIEADGSPASYLEAVVCSIELRSFAEFWHQVNWRAKAFLDAKPAFNLAYTGPEPEIWSPTVRVGPSETRVVFHTLSSRTGVLEEHSVRFVPGAPGCEWSVSYLAFGGPGYTP